jgi:hypothetical protein
VENNYFEDSMNVLGTFYTDAAGYWQASGNILDNVTWSAADSETNPAGPSMPSNTSISIPYAYGLDNASCVPSIVRSTAGANTGMKTSTGNCSTTSSPNPTSPTPTTPSPTTPNPTTPTPTPTTTTPSGTNLSIGAGSDGSSKASGTSYGDVRDGSMSTYWSPNGSTGYISIKWSSATTVSRINIREASGGGAIGSWRVLNGDTGAVLKTGTGSGVITFSSTSLKKVTFDILSASGTPRVGEFETYAS